MIYGLGFALQFRSVIAENRTSGLSFWSELPRLLHRHLELSISSELSTLSPSPTHLKLALHLSQALLSQALDLSPSPTHLQALHLSQALDPLSISNASRALHLSQALHPRFVSSSPKLLSLKLSQSSLCFWVLSIRLFDVVASDVVYVVVLDASDGSLVLSFAFGSALLLSDCLCPYLKIQPTSSHISLSLDLQRISLFSDLEISLFEKHIHNTYSENISTTRTALCLKPPAAAPLYRALGDLFQSQRSLLQAHTLQLLSLSSPTPLQVYGLKLSQASLTQALPSSLFEMAKRCKALSLA
ncbi:hypothetical protein Rs2_15815 [Raphanus sativus]|nr:hypothetical protein Rs2_15815 [Raphanus sativus]